MSLEWTCRKLAFILASSPARAPNLGLSSLNNWPVRQITTVAIPGPEDRIRTCKYFFYFFFVYWQTFCLPDDKQISQLMNVCYTMSISSVLVTFSPTLQEQNNISEQYHMAIKTNIMLCHTYKDTSPKTVWFSSILGDFWEYFMSILFF